MHQFVTYIVLRSSAATGHRHNLLLARALVHFVVLATTVAAGVTLTDFFVSLVAATATAVVVVAGVLPLAVVLVCLVVVPVTVVAGCALPGVRGS